VKDKPQGGFMSIIPVTVSSDAPVFDTVRELGYADFRQLFDSIADTRSVRAKVRYLAALFPSKSVPELASIIGGIISNPNWTDSDLRIVLEGRSLSNPSRETNEVPLYAIQEVGTVLIEGGTVREAARRSGVSVDTVEQIDNLLGIRQGIADRLMDAATAAVREGWTVRRLANVIGVSRSKAHRLMVDARSVLVELGEVSQ
jgi:hypothetical protein